MWVWRRRAVPRLLMSLAYGGFLFSAHRAWGGPSDVTVRIKCPVLSEVSTAEFEARAKLDLSARSPRGGELEVLCDDLAARIRWRERDGAWFARSMPSTASPTALVDALLVASKELVEEASHFERASHGSADKGERDTSDLSAPSADESSSASGEKTSTPRAERSPAERTERERSPGQGPLASRDAEVIERAAPVARAWGVSAGTGAALFNLQGTGVVGPRLGAFAELAAGIAGSVTGEYDFALGAGDVVTVRVGSLTAVVTRSFGRSRAFEVGVGGLAGAAFASAEVPFEPASRLQTFWGALLRARYAFRDQGWRFATGPELRFYGLRPEVAVDRTSVWAVPVMSVGLALELSREFGRSQ